MITGQDFLVIGFLIFLEGILSIDNALVLAVLARKLSKDKQRKALMYGLVGAFVFRIIAIALAAYLIQWRWVKFIGGGYLLFISIRHFLAGEHSKDEQASPVAASFWRTVVVIELTDIAFALDSILAAVALTKKVWVIITGGLIGLVLMRFAASVFIRLLDRFPRFETTAYTLVMIIGSKVILEALDLTFIDFHSVTHPSFWIFWVLMALTVAAGFRPVKPKTKHGRTASTS